VIVGGMLEYIGSLDIHILDCHMYPGCLPPQVLYSHIYRPRPQCNTTIQLYQFHPFYTHIAKPSLGRKMISIGEPILTISQK
jgi:hypothetical protein